MPLRLRPRRRAWGWAVALGLGGAPLPARAAEPARIPSFGVGIDVVNLDLSVTDTRDSHVTDLAEQDVAVFEDGARQQISLFTRERLPLSLTILIDSSGSMKPRLPVAQAAAVRFLRILEPVDEAAVVQFNRRHTVLQPPTPDLGRLEAAVGEIQAEGETALHNALYITLKDLAASRREQSRRRALVVLTDGQDTASLLSDDQVLELARRADIAVYSIGLMSRDARSDSVIPIFFLTALARVTGGRAYFPSQLEQLEGVYDRIGEELRTLYGIGYVSSNPRQDGRFRRIAVLTARQNLIVRHRPGYYAAGPPR